MADEQLFERDKNNSQSKNGLTGCRMALSPSDDAVLSAHAIPPCSETWSMSNSGYRWQMSNCLIEKDKNPILNKNGLCGGLTTLSPCNDSMCAVCGVHPLL